MISSDVRVTPSRSRTRPDSAISAASRPTLGLDAGSPRTSARLAATAVASIAPRTDEPIRTSGWLRVRRTSSTIVAIHVSSSALAPGPTDCSTMAASSSALW